MPPKKKSSNLIVNSEVPIHTPQTLKVGKFSKVKLGYFSHASDTQFAFKMFDHTNMTTDQFDQILAEYKIHEELNHPQIVQFHQLHPSEDHLCFCLEYMPDGDFYHYLKKLDDNNLISSHVVTIEKLLKDVLQGLYYLHFEKRILHRDIRLQNILINGECAKISDFGSAISLDKAENSSFIGSPIYVAPEVWKKAVAAEIENNFFLFNYVMENDIYALGVLLWRVIHLTFPYQEKRYQTLFQERKYHEAILGEPLSTLVKPIKCHLPEVWGSMTKQCLSETPKDRPLVNKIIKTVSPSWEEPLKKEENNTSLFNSSWDFRLFNPVKNKLESHEQQNLKNLNCIKEYKTFL